MPDMMRMDGRNPYGSKGGYVVSSRGRGRGRRDRAMSDSRDYDYDMARGGRGRDRAMGDRRDYDYARGGRDGHNYYPVEAMGRFTGYYGMGDRRDYGMDSRDYADYDYDYGMDSRDYDSDYDYRRDYDYRMDSRRDYADYEKGGNYLKDEELKQWSEKLRHSVEDKDKMNLSKENIKKKAEDMGIKFDKFSMEEFYVAVLMMFTDYCKTLGTANMGMYLNLAKDWLCDEDVAVKYGEKLATYYDCIVNG